MDTAWEGQQSPVADDSFGRTVELPPAGVTEQRGCMAVREGTHIKPLGTAVVRRRRQFGLRARALRTASCWLVFVGCAALQAAEGRLEPVSIQLRWSHQFQFAGYYAAKEKGFYAAEGLDVSLREFDPKEGRIAPVLAGKAQYGVGDPGLLKLRADGKPVVVLAQIFQHSPSVLLTRRDSGILSPDGLVGRKVMLTLDNLGDAAVYAMLVQELDGLGKITVVPHSYDPEALAGGKADAVTAYRSNEPMRLKKRGLAVNVLDPRSYGIDFYGDNLFTTEKEVRERPQRVQRVLRATCRGWEYALAHKEEIIDLIRRQYAPALGPDQLRYEAKVVDQMIVPDLIAIGDVSPGRYRRIAEVYHRLGLIKEKRIPSGFLYAKDKGTVVLTAGERAWLDAHPKITLGYTDAFEPEVIVAPDGTHRGILADVLARLNERLGTRISLRVLPIPELIEKARAKQVDGIPSLHPDYAAKLGLLRTSVYLTNYPTVFARKGVPFNRPSDLAGKTVSIIDKVFFSEQTVEQHAKGATIQKVKDALAGLRSVANGEAEFFVGATLNDYLITKYQLTGLGPQYVFYDHPVPGCIGIRPDWPVLVSILNKGLATISEGEIEAIVAKWVHVPARRSIELTARERAWLAEKHTVRVRVGDYPPNYFIRNGKACGIAIDMLNAVYERTGISFRFVIPSPAFAEDLDGLVRHAGPDLLPSLQRTEERAKTVLFTKVYLTSPRFIFVRDDAPFIASIQDLSGKTVAVEEGFLVQQWLAKDYPDIDLLSCSDTRDALSAVASGKASAYIGPLRATGSMINRYGLHNLKASAPSPLPDGRTSMGIRSDWPELRSIIDKSLDAMPGDQKAKIINRWDTVRVEHGIQSADIVKRVLVVTGIGAVVVAAFVVWNRTLNRRVRKRTAALTKSEKELRLHQQRLRALASELALAEERERRRLAAELHDGIAQSLAFARIQLASAIKSAPETMLAGRLGETSQSLREAIEDIQGVVHELSSPSMNEIGLAAAVSEWLEEQVEKRHGIATEFSDECGAIVLDEDVRAVLFRTVRELATNAVKHAKAAKIAVRMSCPGDSLRVSVEDDGVGFYADAVSQAVGRQGGFGLFSIRERMADLGGSLEIVSRPGEGCRAVVEIPRAGAARGRG